MREHRIKLRGGWEWWPDGDSQSPPLRLTLPFEWPPGLAPNVPLARAFRTPEFAPGRESLALELTDVPGLVEVLFNGDRVEAGFGNLVIPLGESPPTRNRLSLVVETAGRVGLWGNVALVIRPRDPARPLGEGTIGP